MTRTLFDSFELTGDWWLPSNPDDRKRGTLSFKPGKYTLLTLDSWPGFWEHPLPSTNGFSFHPIPPIIEHSIVHGLTDANEHLLLLQCRGRLRGLGGLGGYVPSLFLISDNEIPFDTKESIQFFRLSISFTHLEEWLANFPFELIDKRPEFELYYSIPEPIITQINSNKTEILFAFNFSVQNEFFEIALKQSASAEIRTSTPCPLDWFLDQSQALQSLLAILVGTAVRKRLLVIKAIPNKDSTFKQDIYIYYNVAPSPPRTILHPREMVMSSKHLGSTLSEVLQTWFDPNKRSLFAPFADLFVGVLYNRDSPMKFQFLSLVQALESYHRLNYPDKGKYLAENEYGEYLEDLKNFVTNMVPKTSNAQHEAQLKALKKRLVGQNGESGYLYYGNEVSLSTRLKDLIADFSKDSDLAQTIGLDKQHRKRIVATRNYYTHPGGKRNKLIFGEDELYEANLSLILLITTIFLRELKIPDVQIKQAIMRRKSMP
jgi:hypothetical protein